MKNKLIKLHWFFSSQLGIDPQKFVRAMIGTPFFIRDWLFFRRFFSGELSLMPCLHDKYEEGGSTKSEYFWQDLIVSREIYKSTPKKHVDIGSRIDGFVAHVASFREIEVIDVRPVTTEIPGIKFFQADLLDPNAINLSGNFGYCDSLSCLHALEHFGLGRYGDDLNLSGYKDGIENMAKLLSPSGKFYLSTPIGRERIEFNAHWVFDPRKIIACAKSNGLKIHSLTCIDSEQGPVEVDISGESLRKLAENNYTLGLFIFYKN